MSGSVLELPGGETVPIDEKGYLLDPARWSPAVAETMARADACSARRLDVPSPRVDSPPSSVQITSNRC